MATIAQYQNTGIFIVTSDPTGNAGLMINNDWKVVGNMIGSGVMTPLMPGMIAMFAGSGTVYSFLDCDGTAYSRTTYANLFAVIGTAWGSGNGVTTFNVPDLNPSSGSIPFVRYLIKA